MLSKLSVKNPYLVAVAVIVVLLLGGISYTKMTTDLLPSINLPYAVVMTTYGGASPEEVETVVTKPVEQSMATISNIKKVSSVSMENSSIVILEFYNSANMDAVTIEMRESLDMLESLWDKEEIASPMIVKLNPDMMPVMVAAVDISGSDVKAVSALVEEELLPSFEKIDGVASVTAMGSIADTLEIVIDRDKVKRVNERIKSAVGGQMAAAEAAIGQAKAQLEAGKKQLAAESAKQRQQLTAAQTALNDGKEQLGAAEEEIRAGEMALTLQQQGLLATKQIAEAGLNELSDRIAALEAKETLTEAEQSRLTQLKNTKTEVEASIATLDAQLAGVNENLAAAAQGKAALDAQKTELGKKEQELSEAKTLLESELSKAEAQLNQGEATLNAKSAELTGAKASAEAGVAIDELISVEMISGILAAQNFSLPAGYAGVEGNEYVVKIGEKYDSIAQLENQLLFDLGIEGVDPVYLSDVANIDTVNNEGEMYAKINGYDGLILTFQKQTMYSTAEVAALIRGTIDGLETEHEGLHITPLMDQGMYIDIVIAAVIGNLIWGGLLAIFILLLFLRDLKPTVVIALSIPISLLFAMTLMYFAGITMNIISLAGLALAVGMLVDNSIVVIENIYRLRQEGHSVAHAAMEGAKQVTGALIASTLTTTSVFLPIVFTEGLSRQIFADMGLTIAFSLLASLLVALTLVPAMASGLLRRPVDKKQRILDRVKGIYGVALGWCLRHRAVVLLAVFLLLAGSVFGATRMGVTFLPESEAQEMNITLEMSDRATKEETRAMADQFTEILLEVEDIETIGALQSSGGMGMMGGTGGENTVSYYLLLKGNRPNAETKQDILDRSEGLKCTVQISSSGMDMSALGGSGIQVMVKGENLDTLRETAQDLAAKLREVPGIGEVDDGVGSTEPEMRVTVNKAKAMEHGLTVAQVYAFIAGALSDGATATTLNLEDENLPVVVVDGAYQELTWEDIADLKIKATQQGKEEEVRIGDIAGFSEAESLSSILRDEQQRQITVSADAALGYNIGLVGRDVEAMLENYTLPAGYEYVIAGETQTTNEAFGDLFLMLALAIVLIYLIMVAQFQSLLSPFIVMFTIPLAFTGGLLALFLTGMELSVIAMLGFLVLAGIIVNNGILLVDYTNQLRKDGMERREAIVAAGKTRMRPIFMTAFTTILGLSTLSLGLGMGADLIQPLAVVAIGGLVYGTFLTLLVVPVLYDLFQRRELKNRLEEGEV